MSFKSDIQGQNTQLYPIVTIEAPSDTSGEEEAGGWVKGLEEAIYISTNNTSLYHIQSEKFITTGNVSTGEAIVGFPIYFKPLLLNIPSIKEKIDIQSKRFTISHVKLDISNYEYEGKRFSDLLSDKSLINWKVSIQFVSPSGNKFSTIRGLSEYDGKSLHDIWTEDDFGQSAFYLDQSSRDKMTQMVYQGIIRKVTHSNEKVSIELEDFAEKRANKDLPKISLPDADYVAEKYRNQPVPLVYGDVDRSPAVIVSSKVVPDSNMISGYNNEPLYMRINDTYIRVPEYIIKNFNDAFLDVAGQLQQLEYSESDVQFEKIDSMDENIDAELLDLSVNKLLRVNLIQVYAESQKPEGFNHSTFTADSQPTISYNMDEMQLVTDGDDNTSVENANEDSSYSFPNVGHDFEFYRHLTFGGEAPLEFHEYQTFTEQLVSTGEGSFDTIYIATDKIARRSKFYVNGYDFSDTTLLDLMQSPYLYDGNDAGYPTEHSDVEGNDLLGLFTYNLDEYENGHRDFYFTSSVSSDDGATFVNFYDTPYFSAAAQLFYAVTDLFGGLHLEHRFTLESHTDITIDYSFRIRELVRDDWGNIINPFKHRFYVDVKGRINTFTDHALDEDEFIENPIDIIYDLVRAELGHDSIDEDEYAEAKLAHTDWKFGFTINRKINSKALIEDIAKSTKCFPKFKNDGSFGFNVIKDNYTIEDDYENATLINKLDVISYSFKKTKPKQIYKKVDVQYNKDYGQNSYLKRTTAIDNGADDYYGIDSSDDVYLEFKSDYIRHSADDGVTANKLASFLSKQYENDHLIFNLKLPLQYINLEIGDLVKFIELLGDVKAHGIDYRLVQEPNGQYYYPLFMVTSTQKKLDSISIECMQLHSLATWVGGNTALNTGFFNDDEEGDLFYFPDADPIVLEEDPFFITAPSISLPNQFLEHESYVGEGVFNLTIDEVTPITVPHATVIDGTEGAENISDLVTIDVTIGGQAGQTYENPPEGEMLSLGVFGSDTQIIVIYNVISPTSDLANSLTLIFNIDIITPQLNIFPLDNVNVLPISGNEELLPPDMFEVAEFIHIVPIEGNEESNYFEKYVYSAQTQEIGYSAVDDEGGDLTNDVVFFGLQDYVNGNINTYFDGGEPLPPANLFDEAQWIFDNENVQYITMYAFAWVRDSDGNYAKKIWAVLIAIPIWISGDYPLGDVNLDGAVNILDAV